MGNPTLRELFAILSIAIISTFTAITPTTNTEYFLNLVDTIQYQPWELVMDVTWSPDGESLAVSSGNFIRLYSMPDLELVSDFEIGALTHTLAFDPKGEFLAAGSRDGYLRIWRVSDLSQGDAGASQPILKIEAHRRGVNKVLFNERGNLFASGGNDAVARLWDYRVGKLTRTMIGGTLTVPAIAFRPGEEILAVSNGNIIRLRDISNEGIVGTFRSENPIYCIQFNTDGNLLAAGDLENQILLWDPDEAFRTGIEDYPEPAVLAGHDGRNNSFESIIWDIDFSPSGKLLVSGGGDGMIFLWDPEKRQVLYSMQAHKNGVTSLDFDPSGFFLVSGGLDASIKFWKLEN